MILLKLPVSRCADTLYNKDVLYQAKSKDVRPGQSHPKSSKVQMQLVHIRDVNVCVYTMNMYIYTIYIYLLIYIYNIYIHIQIFRWINVYNLEDDIGSL